MSFADLVEFTGKKLLLAPYYYNAKEVAASGATTVVALVLGYLFGRIAVRRLSEPTCLYIALGSAVVMAVTFPAYWFWLYDMGGIFFWQLCCRAVFMLALGALAAIALADRGGKDEPSNDQSEDSGKQTTANK